MSHTVTCKLNKDARQHPNQSGVTFFVSLGEKHYNHKTKQSGYTNYEAALFAKDNQIGFYTSALVAGSVITVSGTSIIIDPPSDPQYAPRLIIQDAKLEFAHTGQQQAPQQQYQQQQPQQQYQQQRPQQQQQQPQYQQQPNEMDFSDDIPY